jgi:GDSL-like Lipase/Acylhydrolase family
VIVALSVREITREFLNIAGPISVRRDLLTVRALPPPRSLRDELRFIAFSNGIPSFRAFANSRHPVWDRDYDPNTHSYRAEYLNKKSNRLTISAFPGVDVIDTIDDPEPDQGGPDHQEDIIIKRLRVPEDTVAFDFAVTSSDGKFEKTASKPADARPKVINEAMPNQVWDWEVDVPGEDTYHISVRLRNKSGGGPKNTSVITLRDHLVVCLGDSCAAGEGNPDITGRVRFGIECDAATASMVAEKEAKKIGINKKINMLKRARWLEPLAHRSLRSGHARGTRSAEDRTAGRVITFVTFATSGAKIKEGLLEAQHPWQKPLGGQLEEARRTVGDRSVEALLLSIGGNDVGFAAGLEQLASDWQGGGLDKMVSETRRRIDELEGKFDDLAASIEEILNPRRVFITEYPTGLFDKKDPLGPLGRRAEGCGVFDSTAYMQVSAVDAHMIFELAHRLNDQVRSAAERHDGWTYIDGINEGFAGHGYCEDDTFWIGAEQSCRGQGDFEGTMHPNFNGHGVYEQCVADELRRHFLEVE